jgi:hypothetical protein
LFHSLWVGNVTTHTMPAMSKDNFFLGIRAVDRQGTAAPVSFPLPQR